MKIPKGIIRVDLRDYSATTWVETDVLCEVEVMMACFTKGTCRIRVTVLEDKGGYEKGEKRGNIDTALTPAILDLIYPGVGDHLKP